MNMILAPQEIVSQSERIRKSSNLLQNKKLWLWFHGFTKARISYKDFFPISNHRTNLNEKPKCFFHILRRPQTVEISQNFLAFSEYLYEIG